MSRNSTSKNNDGDKGKKKVSGANIALLLIIALALFGAICFINFAHQASKTDSNDTSQSEEYNAIN
jgi:flagellar basal body-associated protein FliL